MQIKSQKTAESGSKTPTTAVQNPWIRVTICDVHGDVAEKFERPVNVLQGFARVLENNNQAFA